MGQGEVGKRYSEMSSVGRAKYVVNHHDGVKKHNDGSPFYDIAIFKNNKRKDAFVRNLALKGYTER